LSIRYKKTKRIIILLFFFATIAFIINNTVKVMFPLRYKQYVYNYSVANNIDPYLVFAIMKAESSFNPKALSKKGARGLMQITERTGKWGAESLKIEGYSKDKLYDPETNIKIGCWYLSTLMKEFDNNIDLVIAAYNGGSGNVTGWLKDSNYSKTGTSLDKIPFKETDAYLKKVKNYHSIYKGLYE
jgi:soluble lytic murein transglycosylase